MEKKKTTIGTFIIASAIVWGAVIVSCSYKLKGTECFDDIAYILILGFIFHLLFVWGPLVVQNKKLKDKE